MKANERDPRYTEDFWWLALAFCMCFGLAGTYGAMHLAVVNAKSLEQLPAAELTRLRDEEDIKERDVFVTYGAVGGTAGLVLSFFAIRLLRCDKASEHAEAAEIAEASERDKADE
jgi:hypothetical protein